MSIKTEKEIDLMREAGKIVADVLRLLGKYIKPGISAYELDRIAEDFILSQGAKPAFKGYGFNKKNLFPATICVSIDNEVVHGIPTKDKILMEGQIVSIDVGVIKDGYYGDAAKTFVVGEVNGEKKKLIEITEKALYVGIEQAVDGNRLFDIGYAIQSYVESHGFSVVRDLVGHGIGRKLHEEPAVPNFGQKGKGIKLKEGMTLAIEPMVNAGTWQVYFGNDGWTVYTLDGLPSAHFEHTIVVRKGKPEILTL
ncbi:MAG: type I methionyl aminopeptidase [Candidatus Kryptonium sp.]